ncbi:conserved hypothetical protein [Renibacterium salmoninarum ATCC 33209]|uniref:BioF2-like acetyltransferase domain-containing protein n=1 Tax=Renibacterium salmoninarum (strain ATCC 33209 / DSM 20767 / JCM 11484 / NBRC 15589 / NCIMB 2235) TaxID=288705 RepID=A9WUX5_RENSM|nr:hypothetical protein [Renibacterium salmoninarum]ABY24996.1 conserved hypothetical protein [Renibacterium salmoninarum ATCC 33209]
MWEQALRPVISGLGAILRSGSIDDAVIVNNALISTNLHPDLSAVALAKITRVLVEAHPDCAIAWRSVHGRDSELPERLRANGYQLIPARSVLFVPTKDRQFESHRDYRKDLNLWHSTLADPDGYRLTAPSCLTDEQCLRIAELYRMLYLEKYSWHSPQYQSSFFEQTARTGMFKYLLIERAGRIDAVIGYYTNHQHLAAPIIGYDTSLPRELGLYRMINLQITETAWQRGLEVHASSGVASFKRSRGAETEIEYTAVYAQHLSRRQRFAWHTLDAVINSVAPTLIDRFEL